MLEKGAANPITLSGSDSDVSNSLDAEHVSPFLAQTQIPTSDF